MSSQTSCFNRTKSCSMYEVRGRVVGVIGLVSVIWFVIYLMPSSSSANPAVELSASNKALNINQRLDALEIVEPEKPLVKNSTDIYAVVFDAGSTGSRVHVFHFKSDKSGPLKLIRELFQEVKPGLSSYAENPKKGAETLRKLLNIALADVPSDLQTRTPISLMATAGLRLLPEGVADNLLNEARVLLREYPFQLADNGVEIMDGTNEGIFSWLTISFLTGGLTGSGSNVAALDMGGGSTQVTFVPENQDIFNTVPKDFSTTIDLFKKKINLYTHSYLGYGLMSTRYRLLGGDEKKDNSKKLHSVCFPNDMESGWAFGGKVYNVTGEPASSFNSCYVLVKNFVSEKIQPVYELQKHQIFIFSYFYDAAFDSRLVDSDLGGEVTVSDFMKAAKKAFDFPNIKKPFLGLDLLYMYSLLHDGYRLRQKTKLKIVKKIEHVEVSWGLGAAFQLLSSAGLIS